MVFNFGVMGTIEERVLDVLERRIGMFEDTVGGLDPILGDVEKDLGKIFRLAEEETQRALEQMMGDIERRVADARRAEAQLADFIMDARSFRPELVRGVMDREQDVDYSAMETFVRALLKSQKTYIGPAHGGVAEVVFHEPFVSNFPQFVRDGGQQRLACFQPNVAREEEEVEFLAFGHAVVDELVDQVLDEGFEGIATVRHIRGSSLLPGTGYQFNYVIEVEGVRPRKKVFPVFVDEDGQVHLELGQQLLRIEALFNDERGEDELAPVVPTSLDRAHQAAEDVAARELDRFSTELAAQNRENLRREREKLERYFDYRAVAAADKVEHARSLVGRLRESDSPSDQKILPVWERNLEIAVAVEEGLAKDRNRQLSDLDRRAVPESGFRLLNVARIVVHSDEQEEVS